MSNCNHDWQLAETDGFSGAKAVMMYCIKCNEQKLSTSTLEMVEYIPTPKASSECPICGADTPHVHNTVEQGYHTKVVRLNSKIVELESALAAEKEARKRAESEYSEAVKHREFWREQEFALSQKLEAAEARIKASQEQEPAMRYLTFDDGADYWDNLGDYRPSSNSVVYAQPPIPPDVAELQRQLKEARKVPEGWKLVPVQMTDEMRDAGNVYTLNLSTLCRIWDDMLSAAPTTDQPKDQQQITDLHELAGKPINISFGLPIHTKETK